MALSPLRTTPLVVEGSLPPTPPSGSWLSGLSAPTVYAFDDGRIDCGDSGPLGWLVFGGQEITNDARTMTYVGNGETSTNPTGIPGVSDRWSVKPTPCCPCPVLFTDSDGGAVEYLRPNADAIEASGDPAPWYDPDVVESAEFLGLLVDSITGLDSVVTRSVVDRGAQPGGGFLGVERQTVRQVGVKGSLIATTCAGLDYGRRWLSHVLANDPCDLCDTYALEVRTTCPPGVHPPNSDVGYKTLYGVGLTEGPKRTSPEDRSGGCDYLDVEFTLTAADPWLYECPVECMPRTLGPPTIIADIGFWRCAFDPPTPFGVTGMVVTIETGASSPATVTVRGWTLDPGADCDTPAEPSAACYSLTLADLPVNSTLTLDGARHRLVLRQSNGVGPEEDALPYVVLDDGVPYEWPESTGCLPTCVVVGVPAADADDVAVTIETRQRFLA